MKDIFSRNGRLDDLLQRVGRKLQISETQRELAEERCLVMDNMIKMNYKKTNIF